MSCLRRDEDEATRVKHAARLRPLYWWNITITRASKTTPVSFLTEWFLNKYLSSFQLFDITTHVITNTPRYLSRLAVKFGTTVQIMKQEWDVQRTGQTLR